MLCGDRLGFVPEVCQGAGRRGRGFDGGRVHGPGDAHPAGAQPSGHSLLRGRRPGIVVLAVDHQHRELAEPGQFGRPVRCGEHVLGHQDKPARVVAQHPVGQERHDRGGDSGRDRLRFQVCLPELGDPGREGGPVRDGAVPHTEGGQHRAHLLRPRARERARARTHQRERDCSDAGQDGLAGRQPAVRVPEQVLRARRVDDGGDVGPQGGREVAVAFPRARRLELPAHVDRDHAAATIRQQVEDGEEVLFAAGVAGDEQSGIPVTHPGRWHRLKRCEGSAAGVNGGTPNPVRQIERVWCAHSGEPYPATLNKTSTLPLRTG